jgi:adenylate kinase family enzyme
MQLASIARIGLMNPVRVTQTFGFTHLSAGDLLREERASGSKNGDLIGTLYTFRI